MPYKREKHTLKNGLRVLLDRRGSSQSVAITCMVGAGSRHDGPKKDGLAHFVEHLLFRSGWSKEEKSLLKVIEDAGGEVQAHTAVDRTVFTVYVHKQDAVHALRTLARIVTDLPSDPALFELERSVVLEELAIGSIYSRMQRLKFTLLEEDESLSHPAIGRRRILKNITTEDTRRFHDKYYVAHNMVLSIVGGIEPESLLQEVELLFGGRRPGKTEKPVNTLKAKGPKFKSEPRSGVM